MADLAVLAVAVAALSVLGAAFLVYRAARMLHEAVALAWWDRHIEPRPRGKGPDDGGEAIVPLRLVS
jgi:hypothetical protein